MNKKIMIKTLLIIFLMLFNPCIQALDESTKRNVEKPIEKKTSYNINQKITEIIKKINRTIVKNFLEELISIGPRMTNTYGCIKAGEYIYNKFQEFNLIAKKHEWSGFGNVYHLGFYKSNNIEGILQGNNVKEDEVIIFNAHYDTVEDTVGANDDGSGVVGVLSAAYVLSQYSFNKTIKFVTFSGEEVGLLGSTNYVKNLYENNKEILVEFNADMIGVANSKEGGRKIRLSYSEDTEWIIDILEDINNSNNDFHLSVADKYKYNRDSTRGYSDYFPFIQYGYESISFWQAGGDPNMHTPQDNLTNVNLSYLVNVTRIIAATIASIADIDDFPPRLEISSPKKGKLYFKDRIIKTFKSEKTTIINDILIYTDIKTVSSPIEKVEFYYDDKLEHTVNNVPYIWHLNKRSVGQHKIKAIVYDTRGRNSTDQISFLFINPLRLI
jgi:aminopeptidase YwaD